MPVTIEPVIKNGGSAFVGNTKQAYHPLSKIEDPLNKKLDYVKVVSLKEWCDRNFITRRVGYKLIKLKYLTAFRRHGQWWVCANPNCIDQLIEYLGIEKLLFDVVQSLSG